MGTAQYLSATVTGGQGGFQLVVLDRQTLTLISNQTFTPIDSSQLNNLANVFTNDSYQYCGFNGAGLCPLFILSSIGNVAKPTDPQTLQAWYNLGYRMNNAIPGTTYSVFDQLGAGDDYALVGSYNLFPSLPTGNSFPTAEASSVVSRAIQPQNSQTLPSNIRGVLTLDKEMGYAPFLSNLTSNLDTSTVSLLDATALQAPVAWPYPQAGHPGQQNAYLYFGQETYKCSDIRSSYNNLNSPLSIWYSKISGLQYQSNPNYSQNDFNLLQGQLETELEYAQTIQNFEGNIDLLYTAQNSNVALLLASAYEEAQQNLYQAPPPPSQSVSFGVFNGLSRMFSLASYVTPLGPDLQFAFTAASVAMSSAATYTHNSSGTPVLGQTGLLQSTYGSLAGDAANNFADQQEVIGNLFDLIFSDWGRMQALGVPLLNQTIVWDSSVSGAVLADFDRSTRREYLLSLMAGVFLIDYLPDAASGGPPSSI